MRTAITWTIGMLAGALALAGVAMVLPGQSGPPPRARAPGAAPAGAILTAPITLPMRSHDFSPPLAEMAKNAPPAPPGGSPENDREEILPHPRGGAKDPVTQRSPSPKVAAPRALTSITSFDGPRAADNAFSLAPADPNSAIGPSDIITSANITFMVHRKDGTVRLAPTAGSTMFTGFGGPCESTNDGDPIVRYDRLADRWLFSQFANVSTASGPYYECVAVSTTGDPMGTWNRYAFSFGSAFPDYPKVGVWPDGYYVTYNMFGAVSYTGAKVCAMDRVRMLAGQPATQQCFDIPNANYSGLLPADLDGATPPPAGAPEVVVGMGLTSTTIASWGFHVDWATAANSALVQYPDMTVAAYTPAACSGGTSLDCIPQPGTAQVLDTLGDRVMNRLAYRNFGGHQSLVVNQSVNASGAFAPPYAVRWYEFRLPGGVPALHQQGTYAPDTRSRWMGSAAMDRNGDIALGYSVSGPTSPDYPALAVTGRLAADAPGTMAQAESQVMAGGGSQVGSVGGAALTRWGDYSSLNIDPADDCTFWFTGEYLPTTGIFNWRTRIGSFQIPGCTTPPQVTTISPASGAAGTTVTITGTEMSSPTGVTFGGVAAATFTGASATSVTAVVPQGAATGPVSVSTASGSASSPTSFSVIGGGPAPTPDPTPAPTTTPTEGAPPATPTPSLDGAPSTSAPASQPTTPVIVVLKPGTTRSAAALARDVKLTRPRGGRFKVTVTTPRVCTATTKGITARRVGTCRYRVRALTSTGKVKAAKSGSLAVRR